MSAETTTDTIDWDALSYVAASKYRTRVLAALDDDGPAIPTTIEERTGLDVSHVSRALTELRERDVVELLVPENRTKGRVYGLTETGETLAQQSNEVDV